MTSQVAITLLKSLEQSLDDYCELNDEGKTAFSMAISALELFGNSEQLPSVQSNLQPTCNQLATDCISRQAAIDAICEHGTDLERRGITVLAVANHKQVTVDLLEKLPSAQPETAKRIVGKSRDGMTLWYQCDMCNEPVDMQDNYCRGCGRRLIDE